MNPRATARRMRPIRDLDAITDPRPVRGGASPHLTAPSPTLWQAPGYRTIGLYTHRQPLHGSLDPVGIRGRGTTRNLWGGISLLGFPSFLPVGFGIRGVCLGFLLPSFPRFQL